MTKIAGYCPMGCGETLYLAANGHLECLQEGCPDPDAVDKILGDAETDHVIVIETSGYTIRHPLRERLNDELFNCEIFRRMHQVQGPPVEPGRYRVTVHQPDGYSESRRSGDPGLDFERIEGG